jgi:hypothetical protein
MEKKYPIKTPELIEAKKAILKFLKKHNLDPRKDYSNHPTFGEEFRKLLFKLNKERDKIAMKYPSTDIKNLKKYIKMKKDKKAKKAAEKAAVEASAKEAKKSKKVAKETKSETPDKEEKKDKKAKAPRTTGKYNYPLIDGREMTSAEKKKYRAEQRKANSDGAEKKEKTPKADKKEKASKKEAKETKVTKKEKKSKKALKTKGNKDGKKKKVVKDED